MVFLFLIFLEHHYCFLYWLYQFEVPPTVQKYYFLFFASWLTLLISCLLVAMIVNLWGVRPILLSFCFAVPSEVQTRFRQKLCLDIFVTPVPHTVQGCSDQFSRSVVSDSLRLHRLQQARPLCPSPTPGVYSNSCPSSQWCHPAISSSVVPFSSCPQSLPASGSFPMSQVFASGGPSIGVSASASVLPMNTQDWFPLGWIGRISLPCKGLSRVFSNITVQKHQFFGTQLSL